MNRTILQIKVMYDSMGKAEKRVADWIFENSENLLPLSIVELAEKCKCSEATIVRFSRRIGCSGYQELKLLLARDSGAKNLSSDITKSDSCFDIFEKISNEIYCSLEYTKKALDGESLNKAAEIIKKADNVLFFGLGNSSPVAQDAAHKFLRAGIRAYAYSDNHMQAIAAGHLTEKDVAIGISHSGSSKDIVDALKIARSQGAATICITNNGKSPILNQSDIALFTSSPETKYTILGLNSRIAALAIIDALYSYIVCNSDTAENAIENTELALKSKKY